MDIKTVFATVGTTSFDELVQKLVSEDFLTVLRLKGYEKLVIQIGRGSVEPHTEIRGGIAISCFRYKDSIRSDVETADLVISHAGAGSVLEALSVQRRLLVVVNENLMGNHQTELAEEFANEGFLYWTTVEKLPTTLSALSWDHLKKYQAGRPKEFATFMDNFLGV